MTKLSPVPQGREIILPNRASPPPLSAGGQQKKIPPMAGHDKRGKQGLSLFLLCGTVFIVVVSQNV